MTRFSVIITAVIILLLGGCFILTPAEATSKETALACPFKDWRCLLQKAEEHIFNKTDPIWGSLEDSLTKLIELYPQDEQKDKLNYFIAHPSVKIDPAWFIEFRFKKFPSKIDVAMIEAAINNDASPIAAVDVIDFINLGFHQLFAAKDVDSIDMLINKYYDYLDSKDSALLGEAIYELAVLDVKRFYKWVYEYSLPYSRTFFKSFDTWAALSDLAVSKCKIGDTETALYYVLALDFQQTLWDHDTPRQSVQLAQTIGMNYICYDEEDMIDRLNLTVSTMDKEIANATKKLLEKPSLRQSNKNDGEDMRDEDYLKRWIEDYKGEVGDGVRPFVNELLRDGKKDLAEKIHALLPASNMTISFNKGNYLPPNNAAMNLEPKDLDGVKKEDVFYRFQHPHADDISLYLALFEKYATQDAPFTTNEMTNRFEDYVAHALAYKGDDPKSFLNDFLHRLRKLQGVVNQYQHYNDDSFIIGSNLALAKLDYYVNGIIPNDETFAEWQDISKLESIFYRYLSLAELLRMIEDKNTLAQQ